MAPNVELLQQAHNLNYFHAPTGIIDTKDVGTPDAHVSRDPSLIRLTGKHPLNAEPPVKLLLESGFITPNKLHIVRNHGPVPENSWDTHRISIGGLVNKPVVITMDDLLQLPSHTIPVTICCAGNRRKEQNMIRPSIGFSWGPAGVGTAYWTGIFLRDVINEFAGGLKPEALHVCMDGNDNTAKGAYGTSLTVNRAMSAEYDVMLAYKMNGEPLPYDHGYPVRCLVPGCIGGRSVKWLAKIEATTHVSQNPFQNADNKVFPPYVLNADQATTENLWSNPDYSVYDLNVNSVIAAPFHGTKIPLNDLSQVVTLKGYAYGGSNRKVTRCEITLDDGKTWKMATIHREMKDEADRYASEKWATLTHSQDDKRQLGASYKATRYWTWVHWSLDIPVADLLGVKEICLKCWNDENNSQPRDATWSLMGMLNNCWYRVRVHLTREPTLSLVFQHPTTLRGDKTLVGIDLPGWMEENNEPKDALPQNDKALKGNETSLKTYTMEEVEKHTTEDDCWLVYEDLVYDCTPFLEKHPGGASSILLAAGTDCTEEFDAIHSQKAKDMLEEYLVGKIEQVLDKQIVPVATPSVIVPSNPSTTAPDSLIADGPTKPYFNDRVWKNLVLQRKEYITPTIRKFAFKIPEDVSNDEILSLPTGMHVYIKVQEDINDQSPKPKMVIRAYTPSNVFDRIIEFVIKVYYPFNSIPGGKLTSALDQVRIGENVSFKGPIGEIEYHGNGDISIHHRHQRARQIGMIAGGTGITPMWQFIQALEHDKEEDRPKVSLIYCARSIDEIIFYDELNDLEQKYGPDQFRVRYILTRSPSEDVQWTGGIGRLCMEEIETSLFPFQANDDMNSKITLLCGPDQMIDCCCKPLLKDAFGEVYLTNNVLIF